MFSIILFTDTLLFLIGGVNSDILITNSYFLSTRNVNSTGLI